MTEELKVTWGKADVVLIVAKERQLDSSALISLLRTKYLVSESRQDTYFLYLKEKG